MNSYHRFIFTTNKSIPVTTHKNDRRNKVIRSSDELCGKKEYFDKIRLAINDDVILRLLYEHFIGISDLDTFHLLGIEQNDYQKILTESSISIPELFLQDLSSKIYDSSKEYSPEMLLMSFNTYKEMQSMRFYCNATKLVQHLKLLKIPEWYTIHKTTISRNLIINFEVLRKYFLK